ncbi:hypothetical protein BJ994_002968 [Arthrobacter pigmenti]|uniref:Uncharacterized protein n=1 Tax=Arthrobacter pigmenti TaxID=271432 RepID=A0A846RTP2_9MICC|nr:hypothetical protein [Arthrobacter pigmenti]NJC23892.1 hypothetical protein [Arthrobacter pigmenti]
MAHGFIIFAAILLLGAIAASVLFAVTPRSYLDPAEPVQPSETYRYKPCYSGGTNDCMGG